MAIRKLHVAVVEELIPLFLELETINYLRHASWYLESENPYLYEKCVHGQFVVKCKQEKFNSVSPDMKLEQALQRASKDPGGIIGEQREKIYVAEWNLFFHEARLIDDVFHNLTQLKVFDSQDTYNNHELIGALKTQNSNEMVHRAVMVISSQGNSFILQ